MKLQWILRQLVTNIAWFPVPACDQLKGKWEKITLLKPRVAPALYKHRQHPSNYYTLRFPRLKLILKRRKESHQDISSTFYIKQRDGIKGLLGGGIEEIMCTLCILYCRHSTDLIINSKARIPVYSSTRLSSQRERKAHYILQKCISSTKSSCIDCFCKKVTFL